MSDLKPLRLDIVSDVVCPWCYIGKHRIEDALKLVPDVPVEVHWRPFFLNNWVPREGNQPRRISHGKVRLGRRLQGHRRPRGRGRQ
ncbi:putative DsbA family dithiol-disulfide isomerase [Bradyrhizobium sp. USDA 3240]